MLDAFSDEIPKGFVSYLFFKFQKVLLHVIYTVNFHLINNPIM